MDLQAQDRCHRIGQDKPVLVCSLITKSSIEERMLTRTVAKKEMGEHVLTKRK